MIFIGDETLCFVCRKKNVPLEVGEPSMKLFSGDNFIITGVCPQCKRDYEEWRKKEEKKKDDNI